MNDTTAYSVRRTESSHRFLRCWIGHLVLLVEAVPLVLAIGRQGATKWRASKLSHRKHLNGDCSGRGLLSTSRVRTPHTYPDALVESRHRQMAPVVRPKSVVNCPFRQPRTPRLPPNELRWRLSTAHPASPSSGGSFSLLDSLRVFVP